MLPSRYRNIIGQGIIEVALNLFEATQKANSFFPKDPGSAYNREMSLKRALGQLSTLDSMLSHCYNIMIKNPNGCFKNDEDLTKKSKEKLQKKTQRLAKMIGREESLLNGILKATQEKRRTFKNKKQKEFLENLKEKETKTDTDIKTQTD